MVKTCVFCGKKAKDWIDVVFNSYDSGAKWAQKTTIDSFHVCEKCKPRVESVLTKVSANA